MIAKIFRYDPTVDKEPYFKEYEVTIDPEEHMTVMALLEQIAETMDGTLGFFSHSACLHGICGRCAVKCNGKAGLACQMVLTGEDVVIEPARKAVVKDLVIQN